MATAESAYRLDMVSTIWKWLFLMEISLRNWTTYEWEIILCEDWVYSAHVYNNFLSNYSLGHFLVVENEGYIKLIQIWSFCSMKNDLRPFSLFKTYIFLGIFLIWIIVPFFDFSEPKKPLNHRHEKTQKYPFFTRQPHAILWATRSILIQKTY